MINFNKIIEANKKGDTWMKIAFVFAPFDHKCFEEDIDVVSREFSQPPPLGLTYAAAIAEKYGHPCIIIDANANPRLTKEEVLSRIEDFKPHILGFMLTAYMFQQTLGWIRFLKQSTNLPVLVGNVLLELYPNEVLSHLEIDYGIIGPATKSLPKLLYNLEKNRDIENIEGIAFRKNGRVCINFPSTLREDFSILPFPALHLLENHKYHTIVSKRKNFTLTITSKGCPYNCNFCFVKNIPYSCRSVEATVDEIEYFYKQFGIREIEFFDPVFNLNKSRVIKICREIVRRRLGVKWACRARVDNMDKELLEEMKKGGCHRIYYGIETASEGILENTGKGIALEQTEKAICLTKQKGILTLGFFLIGAPGDTQETVLETINFALRLPLDYAQFHKVVAKPATILYEHVKKTTGRDYWRQYILGKVGEERLPSPWTSLTEDKIESLTVKAYRKFYFRPSRLTKMILGIKSFNELARYIRSGLGMWSIKSDLSQ